MWDRKEKYFYHMGSCLYNVRKFDWSPQTGRLRKLKEFSFDTYRLYYSDFSQKSVIFNMNIIRLDNPQVIHNFTDLTGSQRAIGMTIDRCGRLYCAKYLQGRVDVICPK